VFMQMRFGHSGAPRILVADDEEIIVESTVAILGIRGYDVRAALSGEEAVAEAASFEPDLLISDISMCGMNGIEAATRITAMFPECRVLFQSGCSMPAEFAPSLPGGLAFSFVRKPMPIQDLLDCVATLLSATETIEPRFRSSDEVEASLSALNDWRWAFNRSSQASVPGSATSTTSMPDARFVQLNPSSARDARLTIQ